MKLLSINTSSFKGLAVVAVVVAVSVTGVGMWLAGCNFDRIDAEAQISTQDLIAELAAAQTQADALSAIRKLVEKTGLEGDGATIYSPYALRNESREPLAEKLAAYNRDEPEEAASFRGAYEADHESYMEYDLESTLIVFEEVVADALEDPEDPFSAFIVAAATDRLPLPTTAPTFEADKRISPLQAHLFSAWMSYHGPLMDVYSKGKPKAKPPKAPKPKAAKPAAPTCPTAPDNACPGKAKMAQICHKPGTRAEKTLCVALPAVKGHLQHGDTCGPCEDIHDQGGGS